MQKDSSSIFEKRFAINHGLKNIRSRDQNFLSIRNENDENS